jgi:PleD family two-component response regulator
MQVAERIRSGVARHFAQAPLPVTVSVGVGILEDEGGRHELIEGADGALMAAKVEGKNVVRISTRSRRHRSGT